jgi:hypothetical protein
MKNARVGTRLMVETIVLCMALAVMAGRQSGAQTALGRRSGPFAFFSGAWRGSGEIDFSDGHKEQIRCSATYIPQSERMLSDVRCASDSYNFDLSADVRAVGDHISGSWNETTRGAQGTLSGMVHGRRMQLLAQGQDFSANIGLASNGREQTIVIHPQGTEFTVASITFRNMR